MMGVVVDNFVDDNRLSIGSGPHTKCSDLSLNESTDIRIVPVILVCLVIIDVELDLGMGDGFCSCNLVAEYDLRCSTLESLRGYGEVKTSGRMFFQCLELWAILNKDEFDKPRRRSGLAAVTPREGF